MKGSILIIVYKPADFAFLFLIHKYINQYQYAQSHAHVSVLHVTEIRQCKGKRLASSTLMPFFYSYHSLLETWTFTLWKVSRKLQKLLYLFFNFNFDGQQDKSPLLQI